MATVDRIDPAYVPWSPSASGFEQAEESTDDYVGKHRRPGARGLGLMRMFYTGKHRRP